MPRRNLASTIRNSRSIWPPATKHGTCCVGNQTAPGDGVYVRVVGAPGAYVTDTTWLNFLPHDATAWRDTALVDVPETLDWLVITNGTQAIELRRDATNRLWRMVRPLPGPRQQPAHRHRPRTPAGRHGFPLCHRRSQGRPATYGLDPAALDVWLGSGTNLLTAVHAGKDSPARPGEVFARREGWPAVVTTPKDAAGCLAGRRQRFP